MSIRVGGLARDDLHVLFFRASFDLGLAIEKHLGELSPKLARRGTSLFAYLRRESVHWMDNHVDQLAQAGYNQHLLIIRNHILARASSNGDGEEVLKKMASSIKRRPAADLAAELNAFSVRVHGLVGEALQQFGHAAIGKRWSECVAASLRFLHGEEGPTRCSFERSPVDIITVHIGDHRDSATDRRKGALRVYFNMQFYFFHEYLSHSFSHCQNHVFVEGYLVWAARELLFKLGRDNLRDAYIEDTLAATQSSDIEVAETGRTAHWFQFMSDNRFLDYLLSCAADTEYCTQKSDLSALLKLANTISEPKKPGRSEALRTAVSDAFRQPDHRSVRKVLRSLARQSAGLPAPSSRF